MLVAALAAPASAQEQPPINELGEIVASARRPVSEQAVTQRIVTAEQIEAAGARTLDEALALLPGVDLRTGGSGVLRINVRALGVVVSRTEGAYGIPPGLIDDPDDAFANRPAYTVVSARLSQRLLGGRAEAFVGADNLFDVAYEEEYGSPQATRVIYGGVTVRW